MTQPTRRQIVGGKGIWRSGTGRCPADGAAGRPGGDAGAAAERLVAGGCGSAARLKAAYRFFENDAIAPDAVLASHVAATYDRLALVPLVLAVQDTTLVDYTLIRHHRSGAAGPRPSGVARPFHPGLHARPAAAGAAGPAGVDPRPRRLAAVPRASCARLPRRKARSGSPVWTRSARRGAAARPPAWSAWATARPMSTTSFWRPAPGVDLLVRAAWDRRVDGPQRHLWQVVALPIVAITSAGAPPRCPAGARRAVQVASGAAGPPSTGAAGSCRDGGGGGVGAGSRPTRGGAAGGMAAADDGAGRDGRGCGGTARMVCRALGD